MAEKSSSRKMLEEPNKPSSFLDATITETTADVLTTVAYATLTITITEKDGKGITVTVRISRANDLVTTTTKSTQSSGSLVDMIIRKTTTKP